MMTITDKTWMMRCACIAMAFAVTAAASISVRSAQVTPENKAAAADLLDAMGGMKQARTTIGQLKTGMIADVTRRQPDIAAAFTAFVEKELAPDSARVTSYLKDIEKIAVDFYAETFTVAEMKEVAAFQRSAAGKKFQRQSPELLQVMTPRMMQFQRDLIRDVKTGSQQPAPPAAADKK